VPAESPVEPQPAPAAAPTTESAPASAPDPPDRLAEAAGEADEGASEAGGDDRSATGDSPSSVRDEGVSSPPRAVSGPEVGDAGSTATAPQPGAGRLAAVDHDPVSAADRSPVARRADARAPVRVARSTPASARRVTAAVRAAALRGPSRLAPGLPSEPIGTAQTAPRLDVARGVAVRRSRATSTGHPAKRAARSRGGATAPPAPTMPTGGQAATGASGGGGAAPELPCILFVILATSAPPALQRHRIALRVHTPSDCSTPLERPG